MASSSSSSPILRSPPCSPRFATSSHTTQLSPFPVRLQSSRSLNHRISATATAFTSPERTRPPSSASSANSLYEVLEIPNGATNDEIKAAYRRLARICHPDVVAQAGAGDEFIRIHDAYSTLSDPDKRADYDRMLGLRRVRSVNGRSASETTSFRTYQWRGQNWETDQCW